VLHVGVLALSVADVRRGQVLVRSTRLRSGSGLKIALQRSETAPQDHPRLHLDLHAADAAEQTTEVDRLVSPGARRIDWDSYPDDPDFIVLADPEGNIFCIVDLSHNRR
jgi:hypothetical protein